MRDKIICFSDLFSDSDGNLPRIGVVQFAIKRLLAVQAGYPGVFAGITMADPNLRPVDGFTVKAEINATDMPGRFAPCQGRWIARCPDPECFGAEYVDQQEPVFMCLSCFNRNSGYRWMDVEFPANIQAVEVAALKLDPKERNWLPGDPKKLDADNAARFSRVKEEKEKGIADGA